MRGLLLVSLAVVALAPDAWAVTLIITPDQAVYQVGDPITLNVFGDAEGASAYSIFGRILFDADLADYVTSHQEPLTGFARAQLTGSDGFGEAFSQVTGEAETPDGPLSASVTLWATAPGILDYSWLTEGDPDFRLRFFGLTDAPGGSVVIVPELSTGTLLGFGVLAIAIGRTRVRRR